MEHPQFYAKEGSRKQGFLKWFFHGNIQVYRQAHRMCGNYDSRYFIIKDGERLPDAYPHWAHVMQAVKELI